MFEKRTKAKNFFNYSGIVGFVLIIYSCIVFNSDTFMPSPKSLIPCFGTVLIILQNKGAFLNKILEIEPLQIIGKSSYSIY